MSFGKKAGVVIGRFQVDALHKGHKALIDHVRLLHENVVILVGDRETPATRKNPLSFANRAAMIREDYPDVTVLQLMDMPTNEIWTDRLDTLLDLVCPYGATLYCGRDGFKSCYMSKKYGVKEFKCAHDEVTATQIRARIKEQGARLYPKAHAKPFRAGQIYEMQHLQPRMYTTVDMAFLKDNNSVGRSDHRNYQLLLAQKSTDKRWRLPGGFVDMGETFKQAASRELHEETDLDCEHNGWTVLGDYLIDDWRIRGQDDVGHRTVLMLGWYTFGRATPQDDIVRCEWFHLDELIKDLKTTVINGHQPLIEAVYEHFRKTQPIEKDDTLLYNVREPVKSTNKQDHMHMKPFQG